MKIYNLKFSINILNIYDFDFLIFGYIYNVLILFYKI